MADNAATESKLANGLNGVDKPAEVNGEHDDNQQYKQPDASTLEEAGSMKIKDESGTELKFHSLYDGQPGRQLIVFIRHFYCGHCEDYIRSLASSLPPSTLAAATPPTTLTVIGCGNPVCIPDYRKRTMAALDPPFKIYADPSCALYTKLGMLRNLKGSEKTPEYLSQSVMASAASSIKNMLTSGMKGFKGGPVNQNGGEWLFEAGELKWCHRMKNTGDHAVTSEIKGVLGL